MFYHRWNAHDPKSVWRRRLFVRSLFLSIFLFLLRSFSCCNKIEIAHIRLLWWNIQKEVIQWTMDNIYCISVTTKIDLSCVHFQPIATSAIIRRRKTTHLRRKKQLTFFWKENKWKFIYTSRMFTYSAFTLQCRQTNPVRRIWIFQIKRRADISKMQTIINICLTFNAISVIINDNCFSYVSFFVYFVAFFSFLKWPRMLFLFSWCLLMCYNNYFSKLIESPRRQSLAK